MLYDVVEVRVRELGGLVSMLVRVLSSLCWVWVGCLGLTSEDRRGPLVFSGAKGGRAAYVFG